MPSTERFADAELGHPYLPAFWLRPETALVLFAEALAIHSLKIEASGPWLDIGCGDGIHAALYSGWRLDPPLDALPCLDLTAPHMYNPFDPTEFSSTLVKPGRNIEHGIDIKRPAVARGTS